MNNQEEAQAPFPSKNWGDILFSGFNWYRKWTGGTWVQITPSSFPEISVWVRTPKERFERITKVEYNLKPLS